jgi:hypothetical protein
VGTAAIALLASSYSFQLFFSQSLQPSMMEHVSVETVSVEGFVMLS